MAGTLHFGGISVDAVSDGFLSLNLARFFPAVPAEAWADYSDGVADGRLIAPLTTFVIRAAGRTLLVDTGLGPDMGAFAGRGECGHLPAALAAIGVTLGQVDAVLFTHLHPDHIGWNLSKSGEQMRATFPNARYVVNRAEWDFWLPQAAAYIEQSVKPLAATGQLDLVDDGHEPAPGIRLLATPGHTPGHVSVLIYDGGEGGIVTGDAAHHPAEIEHPDWQPSADENPDQATRSRTALAERIEAEGLLLLGGHFPAPHAGHIVRVGQRRIYRPLS